MLRIFSKNYCNVGPKAHVRLANYFLATSWPRHLPGHLISYHWTGPHLLMATKHPRSNPYVGPRAFRTGEKIYGRDRELRELLDLLIAERVILLHSPSGAGKSSLVQAGLIPRLQEEGFHALPVARVNLEPPSPPLPKAFNRYVYSLLLSLEEDLPAETQTPIEKLATMSLSEYLGQRSKNEPGLDRQSEEQPHVLIFDQFEEILTTDPTDQAGKQAFFSQLGSALRDRKRWALFSIREDYIAALDPYLRPIPTRFANTYRLDLLRAETARQAIQAPARGAGVNFTDEAAQKLVDDLRLVQVQQLDGSLQEQPGLYVEPVQLQVVCYRLWQNLDPGDKSVSVEDVVKVGDVNQSLSDYYAESAASIARETGISERTIRDWFEYKLITEQGIRGQVLMGLGQSDGLDNTAINLLEDAHLVRAEKRRGATWFELAHDRLIAPVRTNNNIWYQANLSLLQHQAALWIKDDRPDRLLLREAALQEAEAWAAANSEQLTTAEKDFLEACQMARKYELEQRERQEQAIKLQEQTRSARRLRFLLAVAVVAAIAALFFAGFAVQSRDLANSAASTNAVLAEVNATVASDAQSASTQAIANQITAQANEDLAQAASTQASLGRELAQAASTEAVAQRNLAQENANIAATNEVIAQEQASLATSRQLAAQAFSYLDNQTALASLLGVEAFNADKTWEAKSFLLTRLQRNLRQNVQTYGQPIARQSNNLLSVAMSPDGEHMAWGNTDGTVVLWNYREGKDRWVKKLHNSKVLSMAFSPDGKSLASGAQNGQILLWDASTGEAKELSTTIPVESLSFNRDGQLLAVGGGNQVFLWDTSVPQRIDTYQQGAGINSIDWSPEEDVLAIGGEDGSVSLWTPGQKIAESQYNEHTDAVLSVAWSPDGKLLASAGKDGTVVLVDTPTGKRVGEPLKGGKFDWINSLSFSSDGQILASGKADGSVTLWDVNTRKPLDRLTQHTKAVTSLAFSPVVGQSLLASVSLDNAVKLNELIPQEPLGEPQGNAEAEIIALGRSVDGKLLMAVRAGDSLKILDQSLDEGAGKTINIKASSAAFSPDGKTLAAGDQNGAIHLVDVASGSTTSTIQSSVGPALALAFAHDGSTIASSHCAEVVLELNKESFCKQNQILRWDIATGRPVGSPLQGQGDFIRALAFDDQDVFLASGSDDQTIQLWDLQLGAPHGVPLAQPVGKIFSLAFSQDGGLLAAGTGNQTILLWDVDTHQPIGSPLIGSPDDVLGLIFIPDSGALTSASKDGTLLQWDANPDSWAEKVCVLAGRNLTETESEQFFPGEPLRKTCSQY